MILRLGIKIFTGAFLFLLLASFFNGARAAGPITDGLAGAMRSGIEREAALGNPAALGLLNQSFLRGFYGKTKMLDRDAGGKTMAWGIYDGQNASVRAGVEYLRDARAIAHRGVQGYRDRREMRLGLGRQVWGSVMGGASVRHVTVRDGGPEESFVDVDLGVLFPLTADIRVGALAQNLAKSQRESPATMGLGIRYDLGSGIVLRGDGGRLASGDREGNKFWAGAVEVTALGELLLRAGLYHDAHSDERGRSYGLGWIGPRSIFDYSYVKMKNFPGDRRHTLALTIFI